MRNQNDYLSASALSNNDLQEETRRKRSIIRTHSRFTVHHLNNAIKELGIAYSQTHDQYIFAVLKQMECALSLLNRD